MQIILIYVAATLLIIYILRCAFIYGRRTSNMPTGERLLETQSYPMLIN